jgi:hypothetical protein
VWGRWVTRTKEVDGFVGGRVIGFRVISLLEKNKINRVAPPKKKRLGKI